MRSSQIQRVRLVAAGTCCVALLMLLPVDSRAADGTDRVALEQQLQAAREQLDESAREVADLSRQLYGGEAGNVMSFVHAKPQGSMLGINISGAAARDEGVEVMGVSPGGPAERAGLKVGDVVVAVGGQALRSSGERTASAQLVEFMRTVEPGRAVKVDYLRGGKRLATTVTTVAAEPPVVRVIRERLGGPFGDGMAFPGLEGLLGPERGFRSLELVPITPKLGAYFGTDRGLLVVRVAEGKGLPLEEGDVLQTIDGRTPENPGHAFRILRSYQPGEKVKLGVLRQRKQLVLEATMPAPDTAGAAPPRMRPSAPLPPLPPLAPPAQAGSA